MRTQPLLDDQEWTLIAELLQNERRELPTEVHHSSTLEARRELEQKRHKVDELLGRIRGAMQPDRD